MIQDYIKQQNFSIEKCLLSKDELCHAGTYERGKYCNPNWFLERNYQIFKATF